MRNEILIQDRVVDVTKIVDVRDIEADKKYFLNREAGFIIILRDGEKLIFKEDIPYESYPREISEIKAKWSRLMDTVISEWKLRGAPIPTFKV